MEYLAGEISKDLNIKLRTVQAWTKEGLLIPNIHKGKDTGDKTKYDYLNLLETAVIKAMRSHKIPNKCIAKHAIQLKMFVELENSREFEGPDFLISYTEKKENIAFYVDVTEELLNVIKNNKAITIVNVSNIIYDAM